MQLPLFVHTPVAPTDSAIVMLAAGDWLVKTNRKDTILNLSVDGTVYHDIKDGDTISLPVKSPVRASIVQAGTEKNLNLSLDDTRPDET